METSVWIADPAFELALEARKESFPLETGGILLGYRRVEENVEHWVVTALTGPGPLAIHEHCRFKPDTDFHEIEASKHFQLHNGSEYYLGDWHTHPNGSAETSWLDRRTLRKNASRASHTDYRSTMLIIGGTLSAPTAACHVQVKPVKWWNSAELPQRIAPFYFG